MKKDSIAKLQTKLSKGKKNRIQARRAAQQRLTVGLDLGDRSSRYCILDEAGEKVSEDKLPTTKPGVNAVFGKMAACRIALEVGTHSPWVSRHLAAMGHEAYDRRIQEIAKRYPETMLLKQVHGVGTPIALTYIFTLEDAQRFAHSRDVGPYLGPDAQAAG
jgi:hypothetical protein